MQAINARISYAHYVILGLLLVVLQAVQLIAFESLNISGLLDIDEIFIYANILLAALIPVVLISLGFALARFVISFVQRVFNGL